MSNEPVETAQSRRRRNLRKGVFIVPSLLTTGNIFCGFYSVIESLKGFQALGLGKIDASTAHFDIAALAIGWSWLFDFLDGRIARMTKATTEFGVELDSIADVLSFGIAPAVLAYSWGYSTIPQFQKLAWAVSFMFLVCGALRLARFNVQARTAAQEPHANKAAKKYFVGMPIPAGASLIAAIVHFSPAPLVTHATSVRLFDITVDHFYSLLMLILVAILALLMVSTIRYNNFKGDGARNLGKPQIVLVIAILMYVIYFWSDVALLVMATCYASLGPLSKLLSFIRPRPNSVSPEMASAEMELHQQ
ncbi:MAG: CDP-diacylglycerol--serine O-phosphatidyltransferase [Acidobacteriota bacterium]